ncbi:MAG: hypothetical protein A2046_03230 [Bacteroidetes bacterium GWA2_30_7]|nr:MAG: hypothetical protein A2046_03230 [Bacteroidetes bacterium GWA2_30_7]
MFSQESEDSLLNIINTSKIDTVKVNTYIELAWLYSTLNPDKSIEYSNLAIEISKKIDNKVGLIDAYNRLGSAYHNKGENIKALEFYQKSYDIAFKCNNLLKESIVINNMANVYVYTSNYNKAIEFYKKSLEIEKTLGNKDGIAFEYQGLGNTYKNQGNNPLAMEYLLKSLTIREELKDKQKLSSILMSIGSLYFSLKNFDVALTYFKKVYDIALQSNDKSSISRILVNIGVLYLEKEEIDSALMNYQEGVEICKQTGDNYSLAFGYYYIAKAYFFKSDYNKAIEYNQKSLDLRRLVEDYEGITNCLSTFGNIYFQINQYDKAIKYVQMALDYSTEYNLAVSSQFYEQQISAFYADINDFKNAYKHHLRFKEISDSLSSDDNVKKMTQLEMQYEFDKIQKQQAFEQEQKEIYQKAELSKQKIFRNSFIIGFLLMILLAYVMFKSYTRKKKDNILLTLQNHEITQQKEEISTQRDEIESQRDLVTLQKNRIEEIHKEVTDSINYAKRIQTAMLPSFESEKARGSESEKVGLGESENLHTVAPSHLSTVSLSHGHTFSLFVLFRPKDIVSGDFYWATQLTTMGHDPLLVVAVADCTGHGVPGAFMSMLGISFLNEIVRRKEVTQANQVLNQLRVEIINALQQKGASSASANKETGEQNISTSSTHRTSSYLSVKDGMDISLVVIKTQVPRLKPQTPSSEQTSDVFEVQWSGANNPLWIIRNTNNLTGLSSEKEMPPFQKVASLEEVKPDKMPIAIYEKMENFTNHEIILQKGDIIYLMSDGFQDQFGGTNGKKFKSKQLKQLLLDNCRKSMSEQKEILESSLENWIGKAEQIDDITILGIKI